MNEQNTLSISELQQQANAGDVQVQFALARCFQDGIGTNQNEELAFEWFFQAAVEGHAEANNWFANAYLSLVTPPCLHGKGKDDEYFKFAVNKCNEELTGLNASDASLLLGVLYLTGKGVEQSDNRAFDCFCEAEGIIAESIVNVVKSQDEPQIKVVLPDGVFQEGEQNADMPIFIWLFLMSCYAQGIGTEKNRSRAKEYADLLNGFDFELLGIIFIKGKEGLYYGNIQKNTIFLTGLMCDFLESKKLYDEAVDLIKGDEGDDAVTAYINRLRLDKIDKQKQLDEKNKELEEKNIALKLEIKEKENANHRMQKLVEQFTHSLGNVIFPDTIYQVAERLKNNPECRKDVLLLHEAYHSEIIIKLQGELLRQRYTNTNPEKFRQFIRSCRRTPNSDEKTKSIEEILDYAASRVTARFLNQHYAGLNSIRDKMLSKKNLSLDVLRQKFEDDILLNKSLRPIAWINQNLRPVQVTELSPLWQKVCILSESRAEALLFGHFSEILFNAFKYSDHDGDEFLTLVFSEKTINDKMYLTCSWLNPVKDKSPAMLGTGKGLDAIQEDLKQLNDTESPEESLLISQQKNQFQVTLFFVKDLLVNDLPSLKIKRKANVE
jgi:hypothetical protein